jgi:N-acetylglucosaminyldiphosphoundecaprenol N-acetyl-beta-D-mannosaminyltransferase
MHSSTNKTHRRVAARSTDPKASLNRVSILGVGISNASKQEAIALMERLALTRATITRPVYIVNAHTLNLAAESRDYRNVLNAGHVVFADGTGARWAARMRGVRLRANLVGTDLIPELFEITAGRNYSYFLLGADDRTISLAAETAARRYPGWRLAGFHHGYVQGDAQAAGAIERINAARPNVLLVGMGNPLQELWIHRYRDRLRVPVSIGVGGLFDHWAGNLNRAPLWVRQQGFEWLQLLLQQPHKWRRYVLGNPKFLARVARTAWAERAGVEALSA